MTESSAVQNPAPPPKTLQRRLVVEVVEARSLLPKDGQGGSSPYVVAEFDSQKKRTSTRFRDLNPVWNEALEFVVSDPENMELEELEVEVFNDKKFCSGNVRKDHFLGRVKLYGSQFLKRGEEGLVYYQLEKKSVFSWIKGEIGLRIYYFDEPVEELRPPIIVAEAAKVSDVAEMAKDYSGGPVNLQHEGSHSPPVVSIEKSPSSAPVVHLHPEVIPAAMASPIPTTVQQYPPPETRKMQAPAPRPKLERVRVPKRPSADFAPKEIPNQNRRFSSEAERIHPYDLVEPIQYLFVRIVKTRGLSHNDNPYVKVRTTGHFVRSKPAAHRPGVPPDSPEWHQVFALGLHSKLDTASSTLEISVWNSPSEVFLGGVCFDLSDVPIRDPPDSPLAPQWYRLEGVEHRCISGDIQLSVWIGTQADDAFPEAWSSDAPYVAHTRSKVYQSPKLWYLRVAVIEAQDLQISQNPPPLMTPEVLVKAQLGFQTARTRRGTMGSHTPSFKWNEDLLFVAGEPLENSLILTVEDRTTSKEPLLFGHLVIPVGSIQERIDERHVPAKWFPLEGGNGTYCGRLYLRLCLEGGYHVLDEAAHVCSDFRPTAKQLWKPAVGILELGILGARGLLPMKAKGGPGKGSTDAYCVAKYGKKWIRTRTITDCFNPRWNEQYTWQVYDPCTVLTVGVFDNWRMFGGGGGLPEEDLPDCRIGKIHIRVSTLESNKVYTSSYPLLILSGTGLKKMGEIELAIRFACPSLMPDTCGVYGRPLLPRMHYLQPLGVAQQEALRGAATRLVVAWLMRADPPLGPEVVRYMMDADSHAWSMRRTKTNWFRIVAVLAWAVGLARWLDDVRWWRNTATTVLVHILYLVLVWYPDLIVPTGFLYVFLIGVWHYRFRPRIPAGMDTRLSRAEMVEPDDLDEEFDTIPSSRQPDVVRARYDRLRMLAARFQAVLGDFATQGERVQALVSWRDPRATKLFIGACLAVTVVLYVVPPKMVAVALGFYYLRHPMFRDQMPPTSVNFFRRLPSLSDRLM
ncbi:hypothetical protein SAY87_004221 [Trapa incisa]|uniref:C2 domain-containing protein n=1 Tax=Trapa incisa TaxID=236973 RepID=A0AAN7PLT1_9MYRT|nr:hypothetical protein SAY87_004221 [Trapa incisa]